MTEPENWPATVHHALYSREAILSGKIYALKNDIACLSAVRFVGVEETKRLSGIARLTSLMQALEEELAGLPK